MSQFDPKQRFATANYRIAKGSFDHLGGRLRPGFPSFRAGRAGICSINLMVTIGGQEPASFTRLKSPQCLVRSRI
jgi:hypothetical protein